MELTFDMEYTGRAMTAMQKAVRVGLQEDRDKKSKWIAGIFLIAAILILMNSKTFDYRQILAVIVIVLFTLYLIFQDQVAGYWAGQKIPKNMKKVLWTFREDGFFSTSDAGISGFDYETIFAILENGEYMVLCFANSQAQVIHTAHIQGGDIADFRRLLRKKTSLTIQTI